MGVWTLLFLVVFLVSGSSSRPAEVPDVPIVREHGVQPDNPNVKLYSTYATSKDSANDLKKGSEQIEKYSQNNINDPIKKGDLNTKNDLEVVGLEKDVPEEESKLPVGPTEDTHTGAQETIKQNHNTKPQPSLDMAEPQPEVKIPEFTVIVEEETPADARSQPSDSNPPIVLDVEVPLDEMEPILISEDIVPKDIDEENNKPGALDHPEVNINPDLVLSVLELEEEYTKGKTLDSSISEPADPMVSEMVDQPVNPMVELPWEVDPIEPVAEEDVDTPLTEEIGEGKKTLPSIKEEEVTTLPPNEKPKISVSSGGINVMVPIVKVEPILGQDPIVEIEPILEEDTMDDMETEDETNLEETGIQEPLPQEEQSNIEPLSGVAKVEELKIKEEEFKPIPMAGFMGDASKMPTNDEQGKKDMTPSTTESTTDAATIDQTSPSGEELVKEEMTTVKVEEESPAEGETPTVKIEEESPAEGETPTEGETPIVKVEEESPAEGDIPTEEGKEGEVVEMATLATEENLDDSAKVTTQEPEPIVDPIELALQEELSETL